MTELLYWWLFRSFWWLHQYKQSVIINLTWSPTPQNCHQHKSSLTSVTKILELTIGFGPPLFCPLLQSPEAGHDEDLWWGFSGQLPSKPTIKHWFCGFWPIIYSVWPLAKFKLAEALIPLAAAFQRLYKISVKISENRWWPVCLTFLEH